MTLEQRARECILSSYDRDGLSKELLLKHVEKALADVREADVERLTSWVNTTIKGANSGHLDGEVPHE
jgi:hypothetical protein